MGEHIDVFWWTWDKHEDKQEEEDTWYQIMKPFISTKK